MEQKNLQKLKDSLTLLQCKCCWESSDEDWDNIYKQLDLIDEEISELKLFTQTPSLSDEKIEKIVRKYDSAKEELGKVWNEIKGKSEESKT